MAGHMSRGSLRGVSEPDKMVTAVRHLEATIAKAGHRRFKAVSFTPVTRADVAAAEKRLGVQLPPSYVKLVTEVGAFRITGTEGRFWYPLLAPAEIVEHTLAARAAAGRDKALQDLVFFQGNMYLDNFYCFVVSTKRANGEMAIDAYYHDDPFEASPWGDFRTHILEWVENCIAELDED
jgi:hypothetical protein